MRPRHTVSRISREPLRRLPSVLVAASTLAIVVLPTTAPLRAQPKAHSVMSQFQPSGEYVLSIGGKAAPAEIYLSDRAAAVLVIAGELPQPLLVWARSARVDKVPPEALLRRDDGSVDLAENTQRTYLGDYRLQGTSLSLPIPGMDVRLDPKPPLVGSHTLQELLDHSPEYVEGAAAYSPDQKTLGALRKWKTPARVMVFFGSWCGVCKHYLPNALRVAQELQGSPLTFEFYGLALPPEGWKEANVVRHDVKGLPTAIVYTDARERGRFTGAGDFGSPEASLLRILSKP